MKTKLMHAVVALTVAFFTGGLAADDSAQVFGAWSLSCSENEECTLYQGLHNPQKPNVVYSMQINRDTRSGKKVVRFNMPLGVFLAPGAGVRIGEFKKQIPYTVCLPSGCAVMTDFDADFAAAMKTTMDLDLRVYTNPTDEKEVRFTLAGFAAGLKALEAK